jgi:hypothetical protein
MGRHAHLRASYCFPLSAEGFQNSTLEISVFISVFIECLPCPWHK